jgi:arylsulfatase A-like enzyme
MRRIVFFAVTAVAALLSQPVSADEHGRSGGADHKGQCKLDNGIAHIVYIQFDNVHFRRDNPNVPSDLAQMPNLLNFLEDKGTLFTNHHTPLISHTSVDIVTSLTGVYGDKFGVPIGNNIGLFNPMTGVASFPSSFTYWTDVLAVDGTPEMLAQNGKNAPAPWVPFTRAGCDVGAFSIANIELENVTSDIDAVFGEGSATDMAVDTELASSNPAIRAKPVADFEGIAIHCAQNSPLCAKNSAPDLLSDEPGGYNGFMALYGNANVQPQISASGSVKDLDGNIIADSFGNPGFPGFDPTASQTLGYLATMLEAGVPVVYGYIEDAHDDHVADKAFGPGEAGYVAQLASFNDAFGKFFARLAKDGITKENTLFVITADENDHFAGGPPSPANCDGVHIACAYSNIGEIDADIDSVIFTEFGDATPFRIHSDDAPTFYINGNPAQTDPKTRNLEREAGALIGFDVIQGGNNQIAQALADQAEQALLHMITADPHRTPNFILFANPDYFFFTSGKTPPPTCTPTLADCFAEDPGFAWNHGDFQQEITKTWLGVVGPGVRKLGEFGAIFTDHTDIRPTILSLVGLKDDYAHDGRVLFEALDDEAVSRSLRAHQDVLSDLAAAYKAINAPLGQLGFNTLTGISTTALASDDATYAILEAQIKDITVKRNDIAAQMIEMLEDAAFNNRPIDEAEAKQLIDEALDLLDSIP